MNSTPQEIQVPETPLASEKDQEVPNERLFEFHQGNLLAQIQDRIQDTSASEGVCEILTISWLYQMHRRKIRKLGAKKRSIQFTVEEALAAAEMFIRHAPQSMLKGLGPTLAAFGATPNKIPVSYVPKGTDLATVLYGIVNPKTSEGPCCILSVSAYYRNGPRQGALRGNHDLGIYLYEKVKKKKFLRDFREPRVCVFDANEGVYIYTLQKKIHYMRAAKLIASRLELSLSNYVIVPIRIQCPTFDPDFIHRI